MFYSLILVLDNIGGRGGVGWAEKKLGLKQIMCRIQIIFSQRQKLIVLCKENNCHLYHKDDMLQDSNCFYYDNLSITKVKYFLSFFRKKSINAERVYINFLNLIS